MCNASMVNGQWSMIKMVNGQCSIVNVQCSMIKTEKAMSTLSYITLCVLVVLSFVAGQVAGYYTGQWWENRKSRKIDH